MPLFAISVRKNMKAMTIGRKVSLACSTLVAFTIIQGTVSILNTRAMNKDLHSIVDGPLPGIYSLSVMDGYEKEQNVAMLEHIASDSPEQKSRLESTIADLQSKFEAETKSYEKTIRTAKGRDLIEQLGPVQEQFSGIWTANILPLSRAMKTREAFAVWNGDAAVVGRERSRIFGEIVADRKDRGDESARAAVEAGESARVWPILILAVSVLAGGLLNFFIILGVNKVLKRAVTELSEGAEQVSSASGQVSGSSQSLAQGASEQAASLEETSASSEEMSSMTRKNAENSQQAAAVMRDVSQRVAEANRTLADMMTSMEVIGASSNKISKIIKVIDEIAFQTNILALNAAVEAARAGEAGMGFAVVAEEVRNLAQRSAQAAKDTASLIEDSILKSTEGSRKLGEVAGSIHAITEGAGKVRTLVDEVEASCKEQAQGIEQISKAISRMDAVTQRTAANAEESASASEELNAQSQALMAVVEQLQALVGAGSHSAGSYSTQSSGHSAAYRKAVAAKRIPLQETRRLRTATGNPRKPAFTGADFPLDDSEFKEF
jgi:methyl-accepting chemotaxis protein/methyl-accepting chemotaxis protein-1 (serine sensor receptor)